MSTLDVDKLALICEAMWELLKAKLDVTEEELVAKIAELDISDGMPDGRRAPSPQQCPKCGRPNSPKHMFCVYCGALVRLKAFP